ncbi:hypothetical protein [Winogradskyella immobilis]|uniref:Uncharacterized protein n=1 Tax=Winogradskyella immobilis TaxID=2816852 RepID=A0ABS8EK28_9FLAO|nr:hypothetical protein [Winogradskyella immobilis]MCC1483508.1 hypothetical protein [Winogradskyella immobilis]MCG0015602.1 hypothetical protein [Winogradskyella immobilis]
MKLSNTQTQELYTFTQKHYVDWYDVQTELVDHLANGIEAQRAINPNISFQDALKAEFKKFGIMGFSNVVEEKTKALNKHYRLLVWGYFKSFFKLPRIILTLFLIWSYYSMMVFFNNIFWVLLISCIVLMIVPFIFIYRQGKYVKSIKKKTGKKWLFNSIIVQLGGLIHFLNIGIYISVILDLERRVLSTTALVAISSFIILFGLLLYISIFVVTPNLRQQMAKQHPDYKIA